MKPVRIIVKGSRRRADFCPVSVDISKSAESASSCTLFDEARDMPVPFQVEELNKGCRLHWIEHSIAPDQEKVYVLRQSTRAPADARVRVKREETGRVSVTIGGELFTNYLYGEDMNKPCIYPVIGPFGDGMTRSFPLEEREGDTNDHPHHRSIWTCWGDVNGVDFWEEHSDDFGTVQHRYFENTDSGDVFGRIVALHDWLDNDGNRVCQDRIEYRFYNTPTSFRMMDMDVTLYASDGAVKLGDTKEGGLCAVRVATPMDVNHESGTGQFSNSLGSVNEGECWGKKASWCDYYGEVNGHMVGIGVFDHPSNPRYPTYWHVRNYGLMTANPFGESFFVGKERDGSMEIPDGDSATWRYRIFVHPGRAEDAGVRERYLDWVHAPKAELSE